MRWREGRGVQLIEDGINLIQRYGCSLFMSWKTIAPMLTPDGGARSEGGVQQV
jgi:hypothetical protein